MGKRVIFRGPSLTQSGYGVHARQVARWLIGVDGIELGFQLLPWGDTPWNVDVDRYSGLIGQIVERACDPRSAEWDVSIQLQLPHEWDPSLASVNVGMTAAVETDRCHPGWIDACNRMSMIVVPSSHVERTLRRSGNVTVPVHVVPESFPDTLNDQIAASQKLQLECARNVLVFGQITGNNPHNDRKNIFCTIKWLCEALSKHEEVGVVLKTNACRNTLIDRDVVVNQLKSLLREVRRGQSPKIQLLHGDMEEHEVGVLYADPRIDAMVSLTRGEGFGLPLLEAAVCGLPIVATGWSGHTDFLGESFIDVQYKLEDVHRSRIDGRIFVPGTRWAQASEQDFKHKLGLLLSNSTSARQIASVLASKLKQSHSFGAISRRYDQVLGGLLK